MQKPSRSACPFCGAHLTSTQRLAGLRRPARCGNCGQYLAARPGPGGRLLFTIAQHVIFALAIVATFMATSWWPLVLGAVIGTIGLEGALRWMSPRAIVTESPAVNSVRRYASAVVWIAITALVAATVWPLIVAAR